MVSTTVGTQLEQALGRVGVPFLLVDRGDGERDLVPVGGDGDGSAVVGYLPACRPESLGDAAFRAEHRLQYAYVSGAMANGIGSVEIVEAMAAAGMLGVFGAAGLPLARVEAAIDRLQGSLGDAPRSAST